MMEKATDSRLVALHGLCAIVRMGVAQGAGTHLADVVSSLKFAFDMGYDVRKQLYSQLAGLFQEFQLKARDSEGSEELSSSVDVHMDFLQQRVCAQFLRHVNKHPPPQHDFQGRI